MSTARPQAVAGVSASKENVVMSVYPSVGATMLGKALGRLYELIPLPGLPFKLSHLLFPLPTAPLALAAYGLLKVGGSRYVLTNRSVQIWSALQPNMRQQVPLADVAEVEVEQDPGQVFYKSADIVLRNAAGQSILRLAGVPRADVFRETILEAADARRLVQASLATIQAR